MKPVLGITLIIAGIVLGLYVGLWWAFIGGIVQIIEAIKAPDVSAYQIAFGAARIILAGTIGALSSFVLIIPGISLIQDS